MLRVLKLKSKNIYCYSLTTRFPVMFHWIFYYLLEKSTKCYFAILICCPIIYGTQNVFSQKNLDFAAGGGLIMVGEGINDAPALAAATVGIVLAQRASATAIAVADVLLLRNNISGVPFCVAKSRQTTSLVFANKWLAESFSNFCPSYY